MQTVLSTVTLKCTVWAKPPPTLTWLKEGIPFLPKHRKSKVSSEGSGRALSGKREVPLSGKREMTNNLRGNGGKHAQNVRGKREMDKNIKREMDKKLRGKRDQYPPPTIYPHLIRLGKGGGGVCGGGYSGSPVQYKAYWSACVIQSVCIGLPV